MKSFPAAFIAMKNPLGAFISGGFRSNGYLPAALIILPAIILAAGPVHGEDKDLAFLLDGVAEIAKPGVPGPFAVFGEDAFAVAAGTAGGGIHYAVAAAARYGRGRVVAFGHTGYIDAGSLQTGQTGHLMLNAVRWAARGEKAPRVGVRGASGLVTFLEEHGIDAEGVPDQDWPRSAGGFEVICAVSHGLQSDHIDALRSYVQKGGGMVVAGLGWGWQQLNPSRNLVTDHPGNRLLAPMGMVYADGYFNHMVKVEDPVDEDLLDLCHAGIALEIIEKNTDLPGKDRKQANQVLLHAARSIPQSDRLFLPRLRKVLKDCQSAAPSKVKPLKEADVLARLALILRHDADRSLPVEKIKAAPSAEDFPGAVKPSAARVTGRVTIDLAVDGWAGTGFYAAPGDTVAVDLPEEAVAKKLAARIGCHSDTLWNQNVWHRHPDICMRFPLEEKSTKIASPHGGLVYIEVPRLERGLVQVTLRRVVAAPRFVLGVTDPDTWRDRIRNAPAPWAELETSKVILTIPSESVRGLDDPVQLMEFWDRVLDCYADLGMRPLSKRPQRLVCDVQISAGYMHSGYPIMMHLDVADVVTDTDTLLRMNHGGVWGLWHELGHNHQQGDWTFGGAGEVTCNLFTLYVLDKVCGMKPFETDAIKNTMPRVRGHLDGGAPFDAWKRDPFLALCMYVQVQEAFGWEAFQKAFAAYENLSLEERPKNDDEKRDLWLTRISRAAGRNLSPFFEAWGVPTSEEARAGLEDLEPWMPEAMMEGEED